MLSAFCVCDTYIMLTSVSEGWRLYPEHCPAMRREQKYLIIYLQWSIKILLPFIEASIIIESLRSATRHSHYLQIKFMYWTNCTRASDFDPVFDDWSEFFVQTMESNLWWSFSTKCYSHTDVTDAESVNKSLAFVTFRHRENSVDNAFICRLAHIALR